MVYASVTPGNVERVSKPDRDKHQHMCVFLFTFSGAHNCGETFHQKSFPVAGGNDIKSR